MRRSTPIGALLLIGLVLAPVPAAGGPTPLELCLEAVDHSVAEDAFAAEAGDESSLEFLSRLGTERVKALLRDDVAHKLALLRRAADRGHLPSLYYLATWFGESTEATKPSPEGIPDREERDAILDRLAEATFAPAERSVAWRTKDEGFFGNWWIVDTHAEAMARWKFFTWMTRAALHGDRSAWEALATFYPYEIERFDGGADARIQGYAWAHLRAIPVSELEKNPHMTVWKNRERKAWERLKSPEEQARAEALARRYQEEVFPRLIQDGSDAGLCALEPQFESDAVAARRIAEPVGPPPDSAGFPHPRRWPIPDAPAGLSVVAGQGEAGWDPVAVARVPADRTGVVEQVWCRVRDAAVFAQGGTVQVRIDLERPDGEREVVYGGAAPGPTLLRQQHVRELRIGGGETVTVQCRATLDGRFLPDDPKRCDVEVQLWIGNEAADQATHE